MNFFAAHRLEPDYIAPGVHTPRRWRINAAFLAAEERGDLEEILGAAETFAGVRVRESKVAQEPESEESMMVSQDGPIFISHAAHDKELAGLLRDTFLLGGVDAGRVFYSSERGTGIPPGIGVRQHLRETLRGCSIIVELITETFLTRPYCLMELGAAWVTEKPTYPLVVPPLTKDEAIRKIGEVQFSVLGGGNEVDEFMDELHDGIANFAGIALSATVWGGAVRKFKTSFPEILNKIADQPSSASASAPDPDVMSSLSIEADLDGLTVRNSTIINSRYSTEVHGEIFNGTGARKTAALKATFYWQNQIVGTANGLANDVGAGKTNSFTLTSIEPISEHDRYSIQFDGVF